MTQDAGALLKLADRYERFGVQSLVTREEIKTIIAALRQAASQGSAGESGAAQAQPKPSAWRTCWVSLNTSRTALFEDHAAATAKARETGGCVIPLYTSPLPSADRE